MVMVKNTIMAHSTNVEHNSLTEIISTYLGHHPIVGAFITGIHLFVGIILNVTATEIPKIVMQSAQLTAWIVAIVAGCMTSYGVWKTHHGKKKNK